MTRASDTAKLLGAGATILDGTTISTADNNAQLTLQSTDADSSSGPQLTLKRDSSSPADNDSIGKIKFISENDASEVVTYAEIYPTTPDVSNGTEDGQLHIDTMVAGTSRSRVKLMPAETVLNENSIDLDFRVETDGDTHAIFAEGSTNRVGIGTSSPTGKLTVDGGSIHLGNDGEAVVFGSDTNTNNAIFGNASSNFVAMMTSGSERMRINSSGFIYVNTGGAEPSASQVGVRITGTQNENFWKSSNSGTSGYNQFLFFNGNGNVGNITTSGSATSFGTSSDYRLKENVNYTWDATTRLKQLKPARFNFIADADTTVDGFIAHEVQSVVPEAITGEKDAMTKEVLYVDGDEIPDGKKVGDVKEASQIAPQGIDQSKLVPLLVKTIQELEARITALENA